MKKTRKIYRQHNTSTSKSPQPQHYIALLLSALTLPLHCIRTREANAQMVFPINYPAEKQQLPSGDLPIVDSSSLDPTQSVGHMSRRNFHKCPFHPSNPGGSGAVKSIHTSHTSHVDQPPSHLQRNSTKQNPCTPSAVVKLTEFIEAISASNHNKMVMSTTDGRPDTSVKSSLHPQILCFTVIILYPTQRIKHPLCCIIQDTISKQ